MSRAIAKLTIRFRPFEVVSRRRRSQIGHGQSQRHLWPLGGGSRDVRRRMLIAVGFVEQSGEIIVTVG